MAVVSGKWDCRFTVLTDAPCDLSFLIIFLVIRCAVHDDAIRLAWYTLDVSHVRR